MGKVVVVGDEGMQGKEADPRMMARWKDGVRARQSKRPVLSPQVRRMVIDGCGGRKRSSGCNCKLLVHG